MMFGKIHMTGIVLFISFQTTSIAQQQTVKTGAEIVKNKVAPIPQDWHMRATDTDKVYGAEVYKAYDYLKNRTPETRVVVAIIDGGADINHEDIKDRLWVNPGEIAENGIDDDKNGYVDDVHGWNFLGRQDGEQIKVCALEAEREFLRLKEKFEGADTTRLSRKAYAEYRYYRDQIQPMSSLGRYYGKSQAGYDMKLKKMNYIAQQMASIGDDRENIKDRYYGNNNLYEKSGFHGMHVAGIVGATRHNNLGLDGVADVELMMIRIIAMNGDEQDKEVALAIRYAVDNGAKVINMSFGKRFSPRKEWVYKAMRYAEKKGVLLVHAAGNDGELIDGIHVYPIKQLSGKRPLKNFITVGSHAADGHPASSSNYGKEVVDIFAPGDRIYSMVMDGLYEKMGGTSMASPVVTGVIALIWNYFPELTSKQVKEIVLNSATSRKGEQVIKPNLKRKREKIDFADLCQTGGIVNALEAVKLAERISEKKSEL